MKSGQKIKAMRSDRGGEFTSKEFKGFCEAHRSPTIAAYLIPAKIMLMCTVKERNLRGGERTFSVRVKKDKRHELLGEDDTFYTLTHL